MNERYSFQSLAPFVKWFRFILHQSLIIIFIEMIFFSLLFECSIQLESSARNWNCFRQLVSFYMRNITSINMISICVYPESTVDCTHSLTGTHTRVKHPHKKKKKKFKKGNRTRMEHSSQQLSFFLNLSLYSLSLSLLLCIY